MEKQQRIEKICAWLREITDIEKQKEDTLVWLIAKAAEDPMYLARAGRKVWLALRELLPDGAGPVPLRDLPAPLNRLYEDQPERMRTYPIWKDFFGIEETIAHFGNFFERADGGYEEERQALWLRGPSGSGKTSFIRAVCDRLEDFTFWAMNNCECHEHPLYMVPRRQRAILFEVFYPFEGSPCRECWYKLQSSYSKHWWEMPVKELQYSEGAACGIAFVDHRVADSNQTESLPEEWIQVLQREANGGLLVVQCTKEEQPPAFMELIGEVIQSRRMNIKGSAARVSLDMAIIFHANASIREYKSDVAFQSRMKECVLPLVTSPQAEKRVVAKLKKYVTPTYHFMPHVEDALNVIVCASRLRDPTSSPQAPALLQRLHLYDGASVELAGTVLPHRRTLKQMRGNYTSDGTSHSMSIRSAFKMRSLAGELCENECVAINDALLAAAKQLEAEGLSGDADAFPRRFLEESDEVEIGGKKIKISQLEALVYQKDVRQDLVRAWVGPTRFEQKLEDIKEQYIEHASSFNNKQKFIDDNDEVPVDELFLKKIEKFAGMENTDKQETFRREACQFFSDRQRRGETVLLSDLPLFEKALWKHEATGPLGEIRVTFELESAENRDPAKEKKKIEAMLKNLADMGYQACCIQKLLGNYRTTGYIRRMNLKL